MFSIQNFPSNYGQISGLNDFKKGLCEYKKSHYSVAASHLFLGLLKASTITLVALGSLYALHLSTKSLLSFLQPIEPELPQKDPMEQFCDALVNREEYIETASNTKYQKIIFQDEAIKYEHSRCMNLIKNLHQETQNLIQKKPIEAVRQYIEGCTHYYGKEGPGRVATAIYRFLGNKLEDDVYDTLRFPNITARFIPS